TVIKGDAKCLAVAAASCVAKVTRDHMMIDDAQHYPPYDFESNVGYPAPAHKHALAGYGPSAIHRRSRVLLASPCPAGRSAGARAAVRVGAQPIAIGLMGLPAAPVILRPPTTSSDSWHESVAISLSTRCSSSVTPRFTTRSTCTLMKKSSKGMHSTPELSAP